MYYYLFDGDWASNALSWQWVAGSNSNKKYYANQENINKFFFDNQKNTFLDKSYEDLISMRIPDEVNDKIDLNLKTILPKKPINIDPKFQLYYTTIIILIQIGERMKSVTEYLYLNPLFLTNILYLKPVSILFLNYQIIFRKSKFMLVTSIN